MRENRINNYFVRRADEKMDYEVPKGEAYQVMTYRIPEGWMYKMPDNWAKKYWSSDNTCEHKYVGNYSFGDYIVVPMPGFNKKNISVKVEGHFVVIDASEVHYIRQKLNEINLKVDIEDREVESCKYVSGELIIKLKEKSKQEKVINVE